LINKAKIFNLDERVWNKWMKIMMLMIFKY
jgi:hypothetical protein